MQPTSLEVDVSNLAADEIIFRRETEAKWLISEGFEDFEQSTKPGHRSLARPSSNPEIDLIDVLLGFGEDTKTILHSCAANW